MAAPPLVRFRLRIPRRRVLPLLLPTEWSQVEQGPHAAERFDAAVCREVRAKDAVVIANEGTQTERFAVLVDALLRRLRPDAEVDVEFALERRVPRDGPTHGGPVGLDLGHRRSGDEREGRVAGMQVGEVADLVDEHGAAVAAGLLVRAEHEVVQEQLPPALEEIGQRGLALRSVEDVALVDVHPRQPPALGGERIPRAGGFLFLDEQRLSRHSPLVRGNDRWQIHRAPFMLPGWVRPGTLAGETPTQMPSATR